MTFLLALVVLPAAASSGSDAAGAGVGGIIGALCGVFIAILMAIPPIAGLYGIFTKAGKPGWAAIVPIYNAIILAEVIGKPMWWGLVMALCPCVSFIFWILASLELAKCFGKTGGFAAGLILVPYVFLPILGFNKDRYVQPQRADYGGEDEGPRRRRRRPDEYDEG
jgi:hypothetical protein